MHPTRMVMSALLAGAVLSGNAVAQGHPDKPVRVVVLFPAGGAGGIIGGEMAARLPADGYGLPFASSSVLSINPHLGAKADIKK